MEPAGELLALLGPSGSGKTTCLRLIAGFEQPTSGHIRIFGEAVEGVPPYRRNVNTVFQDYALFPWLNVERNIAFGLDMKDVPAADKAEILAHGRASGVDVALAIAGGIGVFRAELGHGSHRRESGETGSHLVSRRSSR